jgi:hypothetical protein
MSRINIEAKSLLNQKNYILKTKRITTYEIYEIKENVRLNIWNVTEDHTAGMNGDRTVTNDTQHQMRGEESSNTGVGKIEQKHSGAEGGQHTGIG